MRSVLVVALFAIAIAWIVLAWLRSRSVAHRTTPISPDDPLMLAAYSKARDSVPLLREHVGGRQVAVKFPFRNAANEVEHVWGEVDAIGDDHVLARIATPLVEGATPRDAQRVPFAELEDWQVFLDDGSIRGGFTTQAQLAIARRDGHPIPRNVLEQEGRFVDQ